MDNLDNKIKKKEKENLFYNRLIQASQKQLKSEKQLRIEEAHKKGKNSSQLSDQNFDIKTETFLREIEKIKEQLND